MIYLYLFITFFQIGLFGFGGGYGMISLIREKVLLNGWLSEAEFLSFIAVSESTPGPLAVNMATFIGASQGGVLGALCATLGVVLPSIFHHPAHRGPHPRPAQVRRGSKLFSPASGPASWPSSSPRPSPWD